MDRKQKIINALKYGYESTKAATVLFLNYIAATSLVGFLSGVLYLASSLLRILLSPLEISARLFAGLYLKFTSADINQEINSPNLEWPRILLVWRLSHLEDFRGKPQEALEINGYFDILKHDIIQFIYGHMALLNWGIGNILHSLLIMPYVGFKLARQDFFSKSVEEKEYLLQQNSFYENIYLNTIKNMNFYFIYTSGFKDRSLAEPINDDNRKPVTCHVKSCQEINYNYSPSFSVFSAGMIIDKVEQIYDYEGNLYKK